MRIGFTLLEVLIAVAILAGAMVMITSSIRTASTAAVVVDLRGELNASAWSTVRSLADTVRNSRVTTATNGRLVLNEMQSLSGANTVASSTSTIVTATTATVNGRSISQLTTSTCTQSKILVSELASTFVPPSSTALPELGLTAASYPGFLIERVGNSVVIGVTVQKQDPTGVRNADGSVIVHRVSALTIVKLRN